MAKYHIEKKENVGSEPYSQRINELLYEKQLTQSELSEKTGIPEPTISSWIKGKFEPKINGLNAIASKLDVSLDYLVGNTDVKRRNVKIQGISKYTGLSEQGIELFHRLNKYKPGDSINLSVENDKELIGMVTCEYDNPIYIVNMLLNNPRIIGLLYSYLCIFNDDDNSVYQGDRNSAILFELMIELRKLKDHFQPKYKKPFNAYFNKKEAINNG